jgi:hypothetical protein
LIVWYLFFHRKNTADRPIRFDYESVRGLDRKEVIKAFVSVEKRLAKSGFRRRNVNESYREYAFAAQAAAGQHAELLNWLADAASRAAYSSVDVPESEAQAASGHASDPAQHDWLGLVVPDASVAARREEFDDVEISPVLENSHPTATTDFPTGVEVPQRQRRSPRWQNWVSLSDANLTSVEFPPLRSGNQWSQFKYLGVVAVGAQR